MRIRQIASTATPVLWQPMPALSGISHLLLNQIRLKLPEDWTNVQIIVEVKLVSALPLGSLQCPHNGVARYF